MEIEYISISELKNNNGKGCEIMDIPKGNIKADLVYKSTPQRKLMLTFLPPNEIRYGAAPVYFLITGGGWHMEKRQSMLDFSAYSVEALRNEGFAVVSIDYRVCKENVIMREIITDCFDAARYISHFADILGIDKNSFVLSGHSAGAHLALMLSYAPAEYFNDEYELDDNFGVKMVAAISPPTMLYDDSTNNLRDIGDVFIGCDTMEERMQTSPISYVSNSCPPTLLCAGTSDYLVFSKSSELLYDKLQEHNVTCELKLSVGGGHCFEKIHSDIDPSIDMIEMQKIITNFILQYR